MPGVVNGPAVFGLFLTPQENVTINDEMGAAQVQVPDFDGLR
jgi:hypothetical protein